MYKINFLREDRNKRSYILAFVSFVLLFGLLGYFLLDLSFSKKELERLEHELESSNYSELNKDIKSLKEDLNMEEDTSFKELKGLKFSNLDFLTYKLYVDMSYELGIIITNIDNLEEELEIRGRAENKDNIFSYRNRLKKDEKDLSIRIANMDHRDSDYEFTIKIYPNKKEDKNE